MCALLIKLTMGARAQGRHIIGRRLFRELHLLLGHRNSQTKEIKWGQWGQWGQWRRLCSVLLKAQEAATCQIECRL
jgi:hypothetical protein